MSLTTQLGKTDVHIHPIGVGTNAVGGHNIYPNLDEEVGKDVVKTAIENGMNFLDTAYGYGYGRSEELIGEVIQRNGKRHDAVIATKAAHQFQGDEVVFNNRPEFLHEAVDDALQRLQTDYIDLFYIHFPDETTPKYEAVGALKELQDAGKIRAIGVSNFTLDQLKEANQDGYVDVYQGEYNLLKRSAENDLFPYVTEQGISFVPFFPFASGLLAGKYDKQTTFQDMRTDMPQFQAGTFEHNLDKVEQLRPIAEKHNVEIAHVVLAWYLTRKPIDAVIPGAKKPDQVVNNRKAGEVELSEADIQRIDTIFPLEN